MREQHTAGPWSVDPRSFWVTAQDEKGLFHVADIRGWGHLTGKGHGAWGYPEAKAVAIQEANGRLMAAAPDMLEALKRCESRMSGHPMWDSEDAGPSQTLQMVRAAIAKAEIAERDLTKMEAEDERR